jgi:hypothetical protein
MCRFLRFRFSKSSTRHKALKLINQSITVKQALFISALVFGLLFVQQTLGLCLSYGVDGAYNGSIAVFTGKVENIENVTVQHEGYFGPYETREQITTFKVYKVWKGSVEEQITFRTEWGREDGMYFFDGKEYLIFADSYNPLSNEWGIGDCSLSSWLSENLTQTRVAYLDKTYPSHNPSPVNYLRSMTHALLVDSVWTRIVFSSSFRAISAILDIGHSCDCCASICVGPGTVDPQEVIAKLYLSNISKTSATHNYS